MNSLAKQTYNYYLYFTAFLIGILYFTMGRFGFFDMLGMKRPIQITIILIISIILYVSIVGKKAIFIKNAIFMLSLVLLIAEVIVDYTSLNTLSFLFTTFLTAGLLLMEYKIANISNLTVIIISCIFAVLGVMQFIIFIIYPELVESAMYFYQDYSASSRILITNPFSLFGLVTGEKYHFMGFEITRARSFTSEPSLIPLFFTLPSALAFTYRNSFKYLGIPGILFSFISFSGSFYLSLFFATICFILISTNMRKAIVYVSLILFIFLMVWLSLYGVESVTVYLQYPRQLGDFFEKTISGHARFSSILEAFTFFIKNPLGFHSMDKAFDLNNPVGLYLTTLTSGGVIGGIVSVMLSIELFRIIFRAYYVSNKIIYKTGCLVMMGVYVVAFIFNDYGFVSASGFIMLVLLTKRLEFVINNTKTIDGVN